MNLDAFNDKDCDVLISTVGKKLIPVFKKYTDEGKRAIYRYLFSRRPKKLPPSLKNRIINLYDPLADRSKRFPDGLRWCINVYVGCSHNCGYCYVNGYSRENVGISPHVKTSFEKKLLKDLQDLKALRVPVAPLHMSNSTDPLQENLELKNSHTLFMLHNIAKNRNLFTSITILTKNPKIPIDEPYLSIISNPGMRPLTVQISCSFWNDKARSFYEPNAPSVSSRLGALKILTDNGVECDLRIDPLIPSSRIEDKIRRHKPLPHYGIPEAQTKEDILSLIQFARKSKTNSIIVNTLKVPISKTAEQCKGWFADIYKDANPSGKTRFRGGSWRLPENYEKALVSTINKMCVQEGIQLKHCMHDVLTKE